MTTSRLGRGWVAMSGLRGGKSDAELHAAFGVLIDLAVGLGDALEWHDRLHDAVGAQPSGAQQLLGQVHHAAAVPAIVAERQTHRAARDDPYRVLVELLPQVQLGCAAREG